MSFLDSRAHSHAGIVVAGCVALNTHRGSKFSQILPEASGYIFTRIFSISHISPNWNMRKWLNMKKYNAIRVGGQFSP